MEGCLRTVSTTHGGSERQGLMPWHQEKAEGGQPDGEDDPRRHHDQVDSGHRPRPQTAHAVTISALGGGAGPVKLAW
jgi:hypothetical protein